MVAVQTGGALEGVFEVVTVTPVSECETGVVQQQTYALQTLTLAVDFADSGACALAGQRLSGGAIAGIVVGSLVGVAIIVAAIVGLLIKRRNEDVAFSKMRSKLSQA